MTEESKLYHIEKIVTYRRCVKKMMNAQNQDFKVQEVLKKFGGCTQVQYVKLTPSQQKTKKDSGVLVELVLS